MKSRALLYAKTRHTSKSFSLYSAIFSVCTSPMKRIPGLWIRRVFGCKGEGDTKRKMATPATKRTLSSARRWGPRRSYAAINHGSLPPTRMEYWAVAKHQRGGPQVKNPGVHPGPRPLRPYRLGSWGMLTLDQHSAMGLLADGATFPGGLDSSRKNSRLLDCQSNEG